MNRTKVRVSLLDFPESRTFYIDYSGYGCCLKDVLMFGDKFIIVFTEPEGGVETFIHKDHITAIWELDE